MLKSFFPAFVYCSHKLVIAKLSPVNQLARWDKMPLFAVNNTTTPSSETTGTAGKKLFDRPANTAPAPKKTTPKNNPQKTADLDGLISENKSLSVYGLAMLVLIIMMLWTGVLIVEQVQDYHAQYGELQKLKREHRKLEIEHQRLLIEQQTFSATPQIAKRAVSELNMYYPQLSDRMILQSNPSNASPSFTAAAEMATQNAVSQTSALPPPSQSKISSQNKISNSAVPKPDTSQSADTTNGAKP